MSNSSLNLEKYRIPLDEINRATKDFSLETRIGDGGFGFVHIGQLSEQWKNLIVAIKRLNRDGYQGNNEFYNELAMVSSFHHPNIISFVGFCDDAEEMIIVYEYAEGGSLDHHLQNPDKKRHLTWTQRLKICLGAARGLDYLHSGLGEEIRVVHRDLKSANILLDANLEAKICDFGLSRYGPRNQPHTEFITKVAGTRFYIDPVSNERGVFSKESDIYSFGVVMFELSSGSLVHLQRSFGDAKPQSLMNLVRSYYDDLEQEDGLDKLIDPVIKGNIEMKSFHMFNKIAHECLNMKLKQRPTLVMIIRKIQQALNIQLKHEELVTAPSPIARRSLESFLIPLESIELATKDFSPERCITSNEYSNVYRGELSGRSTAIKVLHTDNKFPKELKKICSFQHQNIMPLIGYCIENNKTIIIHDYAVNGSLFEHLEDPDRRRLLTWTQRLRICVGIARGLVYLNDVLGDDKKVIRGHIDSQNILLDEDMEAKICLFNSSKQGPINKARRLRISRPRRGGIHSSGDRSYALRSIQYIDEDVYSYGVILVELLSGKLVDQLLMDNDDPEDMMALLDYHYAGGLDTLIDPFIKDEIKSRCFEKYQEIVYRCIKYNITNERRMENIVDMIENAADYQGLIV